MGSSHLSPRVSVCIASYNHARYLPAALESVLVQSLGDLELIVADDGSTDNSREILREYAERDPRITLLGHPNGENRGISATTNLALRAARGEFAAWLGSDDIWQPNTLARQMAVLVLNPQAGFVYGMARVINEAGTLQPQTIGADITQDGRSLENLLLANQVPALTVMVRRECLERVGYYDDSVVYGDWELMLRVLAHYDAVFLREPLAQYRVHGENVSLAVEPEINQSRKRHALETLRAKSEVVGGRLAEPQIQALITAAINGLPKQAAQAYWDRFYAAADAGQMREARGALRKAVNNHRAELWRPRRLVSLVKHFLQGSLRAVRDPVVSREANPATEVGDIARDRDIKQ